MSANDTLTQALRNEQDESTCPGVCTVTSLHDPAARLVNYIERLETLAEEKDAIASDITEVMAEAKLEGYDPKVLRMLLKLRAMDDREEFIETLNLYARQVGMHEQLSLDFAQREVA